MLIVKPPTIYSRACEQWVMTNDDNHKSVFTCLRTETSLNWLEELQSHAEHIIIVTNPHASLNFNRENTLFSGTYRYSAVV